MSVYRVSGHRLLSFIGLIISLWVGFTGPEFVFFSFDFYGFGFILGVLFNFLGVLLDVCYFSLLACAVYGLEAFFSYSDVSRYGFVSACIVVLLSVVLREKIEVEVESVEEE